MKVLLILQALAFLRIYHLFSLRTQIKGTDQTNIFAYLARPDHSCNCTCIDINPHDTHPLAHSHHVPSPDVRSLSLSRFRVFAYSYLTAYILLCLKDPKTGGSNTPLTSPIVCFPPFTQFFLVPPTTQAPRILASFLIQSSLF